MPKHLGTAKYLVIFVALIVILFSVEALKGRSADYAIKFGVFWSFLTTGVVFIAAYFRPPKVNCERCGEADQRQDQAR